MTLYCGLTGRAALYALALLFSQPALAQEKELKNSIDFSYDSMRQQHYDQYLGVGFDYRHMVRPWLGFQAQINLYPNFQQTSNALGGNPAVGIDGMTLIGHRWGKISLFGEAGAGDFVSFVTETNTQMVTANPARNYPDLIMGGLLDVSLGKRWSLTYEARDNLVFVSAFTGFEYVQPGGTLNIPEGRIGVAHHF